MRGDWVTVWHLVAAAVVVSILGFGIGLAGFVKARIERAKATSSLAWETTTGTIIDSGYRTETRRRTGRGAGFRGPLVVATPWAKYSYEVDGTRMRGGNLRPTPLETNVSEAEKVIAKYPKGLACEVHYNPSNPVESVLEPGVVDRRYQNDIIAYLILGSTLVFLLDCLAGIYNFTYARPFYN